MKLVMVAITGGLIGCGDDGARHLPDGPPGIDAAGDGPSSDAPPVSVEGFASFYINETTNASRVDVEAYFHAWAPGVANPRDTFAAFYSTLGTGMGLAIGACAPLGTLPFTAFPSVVAGGTLTVNGGPSPIALAGPDTVGYYTGSITDAPDGFAGTPLSIAAGAGSEAVGGPGTLQLGTVNVIAVAAEPITCSRAIPCNVGATVGPVDELYVRILGVNICRLDPTMPVAIPTAGFANVADGTSNCGVYTVRHATQRLGGGSYDVFLVHQRDIAMTITP